MDFPDMLLLRKEDRKELKRLIKVRKQGKDVGAYIKSRIDSLTTKVSDSTGLTVFGYTLNESDECKKLKEIHYRLIRDNLLYERKDKLLDLTNKGTRYFFVRGMVGLAAACSLAGVICSFGIPLIDLLI